jgi:hypothetical protein
VARSKRGKEARPRNTCYQTCYIPRCAVSAGCYQAFCNPAGRRPEVYEPIIVLASQKFDTVYASAGARTPSAVRVSKQTDTRRKSHSSGSLLLQAETQGKQSRRTHAKDSASWLARAQSR